MHKRTAHRWRLLATMLAATFLAAGSFWLLELMNRGDEAAAEAAKNEPDYIVENFSFVRMSPSGQPRYLFYGAKLSHLPNVDASDVENPVLKSLTPGQSTMTITSKQARIRHADNQVDLKGSVDIERPASPTSRYLRLKTEALTVFPDEDRMQTDQKVDMVLGTATITGVGMQANNATGQVDFRSKGQIIYPPKAAQ